MPKYTVKTTDTFDKRVKKKHEDKKERLESMKAKLRKYPTKYGKPLRGKLHGLWQARMGKFRIWYVINEEEKEVTLKAILHKKEAERRH